MRHVHKHRTEGTTSLRVAMHTGHADCVAMEALPATNYQVLGAFTHREEVLTSEAQCITHRICAGAVEPASTGTLHRPRRALTDGFSKIKDGLMSENCWGCIADPFRLGPHGLTYFLKAMPDVSDSSTCSRVKVALSGTIIEVDPISTFNQRSISPPTVDNMLID
jgi:hypothetical protein